MAIGKISNYPRLQTAARTAARTAKYATVVALVTNGLFSVSGGVIPTLSAGYYFADRYSPSRPAQPSRLSRLIKPLAIAAGMLSVFQSMDLQVIFGFFLSVGMTKGAIRIIRTIK